MMEFREITEDIAINEDGNLHVVCFRRGASCFMPNQVLDNTATADERRQGVEALNRVGWRIGDDDNIYCSACVKAMTGK